MNNLLTWNTDNNARLSCDSPIWSMAEMALGVSDIVATEAIAEEERPALTAAAAVVPVKERPAVVWAVEIPIFLSWTTIHLVGMVVTKSAEGISAEGIYYCTVLFVFVL